MPRTRCLILLYAVLVARAPAQAATYYVSPSGSNANPGSRERPWATPGFGARQLAAGDTLVILGGTYVLADLEGDTIVPPSGTAAAWTTIRGEEGDRPVLAGRDNLLTAIALGGAEYVRIENLEITHDGSASGEGCWFRDGVEILGAPARHIVLSDLFIHHLDEFGMNIQDAEDLRVVRCRIEYCGFGALGGPAGEQGGWRDVTVQGCSLSWSGHYYQGGDGTSRPYDRPDGFGIEPSDGPVLIEDTVAQHNAGDGLDSKAANTTIRRCIVANNSCDGVKLWGRNSRVENTLVYGRGDDDPTPSPWAAIVIHQERERGARFEIVNVTVDDEAGQNYVVYVQYGEPTPVEVVLRNTIVSGRGDNCPIYVHPASTLVLDHTLLHLPRNDTVITRDGAGVTCADLVTLDPASRCGDPRFVRPAWGVEGDYRLQGGSPAIDAGTPIGAPLEDLEGRLRDAKPDLGAFEFGAPPLPRPRRVIRHLPAP